MQLFSNQKKAFGLDVSGSALKILELDRGGKEIKLRAFSDVPLPKGIIVNDVFADGKAFSQMLKPVCRSASTGSCAPITRSSACRNPNLLSGSSKFPK